ncbi:MAG: MFS transporter [Pseudomonadota bacterium]
MIQQLSPAVLLRLFRTNQTAIAICVTTAIVMMGQGIISPVLPLFAKEFGVNMAMIGVTVAVFSLGRMFFNVPAGVLAERFGRRIVLISGLFIITIASVLMAISSSYIELVVGRFFTGVGSAIYLTSSLTVLADVSTPANRARYMSYQQGSLLLGSGFGPAVGGFAAELWGYHSAFYILAGISFIGVVWAFLQLPETARLSAAKAAVTASPAPKPREPGTLRGMIALVSNLNFMLVSLYFFMVVFTRNGGRGSMLPLLGDAHVGLGPGEIGLVFTIMAFVNFGAVIPAGWLADRYGRKALMLPGGIITALGLVMFLFSTSFPLFLLASVVLGIGAGVIGPSPAAFVADAAPERGRGLAIGLFRTFGDIGGMIGPVLLGWLADVGSFSSAMNTNAALVLISAAAVALFAKEAASSRTAGSRR